MTIWCKFPGCHLTFAKDGTRACRRHQCSQSGCRDPIHIGTRKCFYHNANKVAKSVLSLSPGEKVSLGDLMNGGSLNMGGPMVVDW